MLLRVVDRNDESHSKISRQLVLVAATSLVPYTSRAAECPESTMYRTTKRGNTNIKLSSLDDTNMVLGEYARLTFEMTLTSYSIHANIHSNVESV